MAKSASLYPNLLTNDCNFQTFDMFKSLDEKPSNPASQRSVCPINM